MRKQQYRQIIKTIGILRDAHCAEQYADAQSGALAVGNFIEHVVGEGTQTVELLTEYCEALFKVSNGGASEKLLNECWQKIDASARSEIKPDKMEIVFLCYKASMSDSVLSMYYAAKADPNCNAIWLPIPYYGRNPDGTFGIMYYEGAEHYPGIDCADWREYDIEIRRPDCIVTYNPYDEGGYVTSVHPAYYTSKLRDLTELLMYCPYFVGADDIQEHFAIAVGCAYAHKVAVQSESVRSSYINHFKRAYGNQFGKPEDKFVALGSPKFDAVVNSSREAFALPDAWRERIGSKKVVLYNTTVAEIINSNAQNLLKVRAVLKLFERRDDVVLWWRPHPLFEQTYESIEKSLAEEYRAIVAGYKEASFGIFDDTSNLHRAIAWSDAYYGDGSSVMHGYRIQGKAIMWQNPEIFQYDTAKSIKKDKLEETLGEELERADTMINKWLFHEWEQFDLSLFLDMIINCRENDQLQMFLKKIMLNIKASQPPIDGMAGQSIYDYAKKVILG